MDVPVQATSIPQIKIFQFDQDSTGTIQNSVNLFRGEASFPLNIISLPGPAGLDVNVTLLYQSNVQNMVNIWNRDAATSSVGAGWTLPAEQIAVNTKGTGTSSDKEYYLFSQGNTIRLYQTGQIDSALVYETETYLFWRVLYYPLDERWEITKEDGTTFIYGGNAASNHTDTDGNRLSQGDSIEWGIRWGNWMGASSAVETDSTIQFPLVWHLAQIRNTWNRSASFAYLNDRQHLAITGPTYTRSCYLSQITDTYGRATNFLYQEKFAYEYAAPHDQGDDPNAYQEKYEPLFLDSVEVKNTQQHRLYLVKFGYDFYNLSFTSDNDAFKKRYLTSITQYNEHDEYLPDLRFSYYINGYSSSTPDPHPGALKTIMYPQGGTATYSYERVPLPNTSNDFRVENSGSGVPRVWISEDYTVVTRYDSTNQTLTVSAYTWVGNWVEWVDSTPIQSVALDDIDHHLSVQLAGSFFAVSFTNTFDPSQPLQSLYLYRRNPYEYGDWSRTNYDYQLSTIDGPTKLVIGERFVLLYHAGIASGQTIQRLTWDRSSGEWNTEALQPANPSIALAGQNNFYLTCSYGDGNGYFELWYLPPVDSWTLATTWNQGFTIRTEGLPPNFWNDTFWSLGATFASTVFVSDLDAVNQTVTYTVQVYLWDEAFQLLTPAFAATTYTDSISLPFAPSAVFDSLIANNAHLQRYDGSNWQPAQLNVDQSSQTDSPPANQFAVGEDIVVVSRASSNDYAQFHPGSDDWDTSSLSVSGRYPTVSGNYLTIGTTVFYQDATGTWELLSTSLAEDTNLPSIQNRAPNYMAYEVGTNEEAITYVSFPENGELSDPVPLPNLNQRVSVDHPVRGTVLAGENTFLTYASEDHFDTAQTVYLYRVVNRQAFGAQKAYRVATLTIDDGDTSREPSTTAYIYDDDTATFDAYSQVAQYYHVGTIANVPVKRGKRPSFDWSDPSEAPNGLTEYYYFNGLSADNPYVDYPVDEDTNAGLYYSLLNGQLLSTTMYDSAKKQVASTVNYWYIYTSRFDPDGTQKSLQGTFTCLQKQESIINGIKRTTRKEYDLRSGQVTKETLAISNSLGAGELRTTEYTYWWEIYDSQQTTNSLKTIIQTLHKSISNTTESITAATATTWRRFSSDGRVLHGTGDGHWGAYQSYQLIQAPGANFPGFQDWYGDAPLTRKGWLRATQVMLRTPDGEVCESADAYGIVKSVIFDRSNRLPIATFLNSSLQQRQAGYYGFEPYEANPEPSWTFDTALLSSDDAHTGTYSLKLVGMVDASTGLQGTFGPFSTPETYLFSCWVKTMRGYVASNEAFIQVSFAANGRKVGHGITQGIPATDGQWAFVKQEIDLKTVPLAEPLTVNISVCNRQTATPIYLDNVRFSVLASSFSARVYDGNNDTLLATLSSGENTMRYFYDAFHRRIASVGPREKPRTFTARYMSRQGNSAFNGADPNNVFRARARSGGVYDSFRQELNPTLWDASPEHWMVYNGALIHTGTARDAVTLKGSDAFANYCIRVIVSPPAKPSEAFGIRITNQFVLQWTPATSWQLLDLQTGQDTVPLKSVPMQAAEWIVSVIGGAVLVYVGGQQLFSYDSKRALTGTVELFATERVAFSEFFVFLEPRISITFTDGSSRETQKQLLDGPKTIVSQKVYDGVDNLAIQTKSAIYQQPARGFRSDFIQTIDALTGVMTGYVAHYYSSEGAGFSEDGGYPYYRTLFEDSPLKRPVEKGLPGAQFAIGSATGHTTKYANLSSLYPLASGEEADPTPQYFLQQTTNPDGVCSFTLTNQIGQTVFTGSGSVAVEGNVASFAHNSSSLTSYVFDTAGNLIQITPPNGTQKWEGQDRVWASTMTYDFMGHMLTRTTPDAGTTRYIYDQTGRLRFMQEPEGAKKQEVLYWVYDRFNRIIEKGMCSADWGDGSILQAYADASPDQPQVPDTHQWRKRYTYTTDGVAFRPDAIGLLQSVQTRNGVGSQTDVIEDFAYDEQGNIIRHGMQALAYDGQRYETRYTYNQFRQVTRITYPSISEEKTPPLQVMYTYNTLGLITAVGTPEVPDLFATYTYNAQGSIEKEILNSQGAKPFPFDYTYNPCAWVTGIGSSGTPFEQRLTFAPDAEHHNGHYDGNIGSTSVSYNGHEAPEGYEVVYTYDSQASLTGTTIAQKPEWNEGAPVRYDPNGNIQFLQRGDLSFTYHYKPGTNQLGSVTTNQGNADKNSGASTSLQYDANGNVISSSAKNLSLSYDPFTQTSTQVLVGENTIVKFAYGGRNQRVLKTVVSNEQPSSEQKKHAPPPDLHQGEPHLQREDHVENHVQHTLYLHGVSPMPLCEKSTGNDSRETGTVYIYGPRGLIAMQADSLYFVARDHEGSTRLICDAQSNVVATYDYYAFGALARVTGTHPDLLSYLYTGQEYDRETGLYNYISRFYDPNLGRFYQTDSQGQFASPYVYAGNNPIALTDPTGALSVWGWIGVAVLGVALVTIALSLVGGGLTLDAGIAVGLEALAAADDGVTGGGAAVGEVEAYETASEGETDYYSASSGEEESAASGGEDYYSASSGEEESAASGGEEEPSAPPQSWAEWSDDWLRWTGKQVGWGAQQTVRAVGYTARANYTFLSGVVEGATEGTPLLQNATDLVAQATETGNRVLSSLRLIKYSAITIAGVAVAGSVAYFISIVYRNFASR